MPKSKGVILKGSANGIAFEDSLANAIKNTPLPNGDIPQHFKLIEFYVETGGIVGKPTSHIKVRCTNIAE